MPNRFGHAGQRARFRKENGNMSYFLSAKLAEGYQVGRNASRGGVLSIALAPLVETHEELFDVAATLTHQIGEHQPATAQVAGLVAHGCQLGSFEARERGPDGVVKRFAVRFGLYADQDQCGRSMLVDLGQGPTMPLTQYQGGVTGHLDLVEQLCGLDDCPGFPLGLAEFGQ